MKRSTDRFLTTHTGSLPRPADLTATLEAMDAGTLPDATAFDARVERAVADVVKRQVDSGVDVVSDGEQGKVGYSTYVRHRLTGFDGQSAVAVRADWADFPDAAARWGRSPVSRPACTGPIDWKDRRAVQKDIQNAQAAAGTARPHEMFMTAAHALADCVKSDDLGQGSLYPALPRIREVSARIATAVANVAYQNGLAAGPPPNDLSGFIEGQMYDPQY